MIILNFLNLIYAYSNLDQKKEAFETAEAFLEQHPKSHLVHIALYKFYLDDNNTEKAVNSMETVLNSNKIKPEAKLMVLSDFVKFVKTNPEYESKLIEITSQAIDDENVGSNIEVAQYFLTKGEKNKALEYYEKALVNEPDNFGILRNVLLLFIDVEDYERATQKSNDALDKFPSQPLFYLIQGVAQNKLNKPAKAILALETGLDYVIDDTKMESDFYKQLSVSYALLNNTTKSKTFSDKAKQLESTN